jgi:amino acid transporter
MAGIEGAMVYIATAILIIAKFALGRVLQGKGGIILEVGLGIGLVVAAGFVSGFCSALGVILVVAAILIGGVAGVIGVFISGSLPFVGGAISSVTGPFMGILYIILILAIIEFVIKLLSIFAVVPVLGIIVMILGIVVPLIQLYFIWSIFSGAFVDLPNCLGWTGGMSPEIPGTGGIRIGT